MISTRDILRKVRAVEGIEQITRAMKTVASIRLRRAEQRVLRARPYLKELTAMVSRVAAVTTEHPFLEEREGGRTVVVLVTGDRGLCGGYNMAAVRQAMAVGPASEVGVIAVGRKGMAQMVRRGYEVVDRMVPLGGEPAAREVWALAGRIGERYGAGEMGRVVLVYSDFLGGASYRVRSEVVLPVVPTVEEAPETIFEPEPRRLLVGLMDRYLRATVLSAVLEGSASEHAARVAAMTAATENAEDMISELRMDYNKARQAGITRELSEIVGTAEATA